MKRMIAVMASAVALAAAAPAMTASAQQAPGTASTVGIKAGTYQIDASHTQVTLSWMHMGFNPYHAIAQASEGTLVLDPAKPAASSVQITVPVANIKTNSEHLDAQLAGEGFFDAAKFPNITFKSTSVVADGKGGANVTGNLTIKGVTKPVTIKAKFVGQGTNPMAKTYTVGFEGWLTIKRSDFGVDAYVPVVGDEVKMQISAAFEMK